MNRAFKSMLLCSLLVSCYTVQAFEERLATESLTFYCAMADYGFIDGRNSKSDEWDELERGVAEGALSENV